MDLFAGERRLGFLTAETLRAQKGKVLGPGLYFFTVLPDLYTRPKSLLGGFDFR